jgi:hypothetical protein
MTSKTTLTYQVYVAPIIAASVNPLDCLRGSAGCAMHHGNGPRCRTSTVSEEMACASCS